MTPLGVNVPTSWNRLLNGHSGISYLEDSSVGSKVAAKVPCNNGKALLPVSKYVRENMVFLICILARKATSSVH